MHVEVPAGRLSMVQTMIQNNSSASETSSLHTVQSGAAMTISMATFASSGESLPAAMPIPTSTGTVVILQEGAILPAGTIYVAEVVVHAAENASDVGSDRGNAQLVSDVTTFMLFDADGQPISTPNGTSLQTTTNLPGAHAAGANESCIDSSVLSPRSE
eukprot:4933620-Prymnesium_polylepis.1